MIRVPREQSDDEDRPIRPSDEWFERARELTRQMIREFQEGGAPKFDRRVWREDTVIAALSKLFAEKCAYCESSVRRPDIDHFRPKGTPREAPQHPGYYWLAYEWRNLYSACADCNRYMGELPDWDDPERGSPTGKWNRFPLADETTRAWTPDDDVTNEEALLLDPCNDDPEKHFTHGIFGEVRARSDSRSGVTTIKLLGLNERWLERRRSEVIELVSIAHCVISSAERRGNEEAMQHGRDLLTKVCDPASEYAGAARYASLHPDEFGIVAISAS